jgi:lipid-binding SYLF domain-containing protein
MKKIPPRIIQNAAGIAIFTCMRSGLWMTGSGGSGILIARKADGTWSPPSGILLHTPTLSFIIGVDIYDCVLVINDLAALESLIRPSVTLGEDVALTAGPLVPLGSNEIDVRWKDLGNTVLTYLKARGQSQSVNLNGCILNERSNENERFYAGNVTAMDILAGNVAKNVEETRPIFEVIKAAEGRTDFDAAMIENLSTQCAPGDAMIESPVSASPASPRPAFGIPNVDDPDPFGVLALEMAGLEIREAGTRHRPSSNQFEYNPSPGSPLTSKFQRQSVDTYLSQSNRGSYMSTKTMKTNMSDACTQTDVANTPETTPSPSQSEDGRDRASFDHFTVSKEPEEIDYTKIDLSPLREISGERSLDGTTVTESADSADERHTRKEGKASAAVTTLAPHTPIDEEEAAAVQPVRTAVMTSQGVQAKGALVTIPKRIAPPLPLRSPARNSRASKSEIGEVIAQSPLRQSFNEAELQEAQESAGTENVEDVTETTAIHVAHQEAKVSSEVLADDEISQKSIAVPSAESHSVMLNAIRNESSEILAATAVAVA